MRNRPTRTPTVAPHSVPFRDALRSRVIVAIIVAAATTMAASTTISAATTALATPLPATAVQRNAIPTNLAEPGVYMVWGSPSDPQTMTYVHGGQIVFNWNDIEPGRGNFQWDSPKNALTAQLKLYHDLGKAATIQVDSSQKPPWIYNYGILKCGIRSIPNYPTRTPYDVPQYWAPGYQPIMQEMLTSLATQLRDSPYRDAVAGIRSSPNLIGTEHYLLDDPYVTLDPTNGTTCKNQWTKDLGQQVYSQVMKMYYNTFEPDIRPILREDFFTALGSYSGDPATFLGVHPGKTQAWFFVTSGDPNSSASNKNTFFYTWAKPGSAIAYSESFLGSAAFTNPVSWNYWRQLMELDRGVSYIATYGDDLILGQNNPEYRAAFDFANKYAGQASDRTQAPGAWVAFSPDLSGTVGNTHGNFGYFITQYNADGSPGGDTATVGLNSLGSGNDPGSAMIGPTDQRYGRYARRTDAASGKKTFYLRLDTSFKTSLTRSVKINVTYLDQGHGSFVIKWGAGTNQQQTVTKRNSGRWVTVSFGSVPATSFQGHLPVSSDITLSVVTEDTTFHMVEVAR